MTVVAENVEYVRSLEGPLAIPRLQGHRFKPTNTGEALLDIAGISKVILVPVGFARDSGRVALGLYRYLGHVERPLPALVGGVAQYIPDSTHQLDQILPEKVAKGATQRTY